MHWIKYIALSAATIVVIAGIAGAFGIRQWIFDPVGKFKGAATN